MQSSKDEKFLKELQQVKEKYPTIVKDAEDFNNFMEQQASYDDSYDDLGLSGYTSEYFGLQYLLEEKEVNIVIARQFKYSINMIEQQYINFLNFKKDYLFAKRKVKEIVEELIRLNLGKRKAQSFWDQLSPKAFEDEVLKLFGRLGYKTTSTPYTADGGVDGIIEKDEKRMALQCKMVTKPVGEPVVRDLFGVITHLSIDEGWVITNSSFSNKARDWVKDKPIHLIDGRKLFKLIQEAYPEKYSIKGKSVEANKLELIREWGELNNLVDSMNIKMDDFVRDALHTEDFELRTAYIHYFVAPKTKLTSSKENSKKVQVTF